jgi:hypothetical protein
MRRLIRRAVTASAAVPLTAVQLVHTDSPAPDQVPCKVGIEMRQLPGRDATWVVLHAPHPYSLTAGHSAVQVDALRPVVAP